MKTLLLLAVAVVGAGTPAFADETCRAALADLGGTPSGIYVPAAAGLSHWRALKATDSLNSQVPLVYFRLGSHPGAIAVKIIKQPGSGEGLTSSVRLRRQDDIPQCGIGPVARLAVWWSPRSYENGVYVSADDYVRYHAERVSIAELERFHIKYLGRNNACIPSNDPTNGNRAQFLFDDKRTPANPFAVAASNIGIASSGPAYGAGLLTGAAFAETIIATYSAADGCASFEFRSAGPGSYVLHLNDLEKLNRKNLRARHEIERKFTVAP